jgi:hypothetical protein
MGALNKIACNTANSNTGTPKCSFDFKLIEGGMLIPKGTKFTEAQVRVLRTTLLTLASNNAEASRGYPLQDFIGIESKGEDVSLTNTPYGTPVKGRPARLHLVMEYAKGGMNRENMLSTFEDAQGAYDYLIFDTPNRAVVGTKPDTNTDGYVLQGLSLDLIYIPSFKVDPNGGATKHYFGLAFTNIEELTKRMAYYILPEGQSTTSIKGLSNLELSVSTALAAGVVKLNIETDFGAQDLYDTYGAALQALTWTATVDAGGASITVVTALDATSKSLQFTFSGTPYTSLASSGTFTLYSPAVSAMASTVPLFANSSIQLVKP